MTQAAFELQRTNKKVIDIALKYGYSSPTSFNRAFQNVHGIAPAAAKNMGSKLNVYPAIKFSIKVTGGSAMSYYIAEKEAMRIVYNEVEDYLGENGLYWYTEGGKERKKEEENPASTYVTVAPHIPFIEADIWLACQVKADTNKQLKNSGKGTYSFLSGLMKCGYGGLAATVATRETGDHKLICNGKKRHTCNGISTSILLKEVEDHVEVKLLQYLQYKIANSLTGISENENVDNKELNRLNI